MSLPLIFSTHLEPRQPQIWECYMDDECGPERACIDRMCLNPCNNYCGVGALCRVSHHKPICSCPKGHSGEPKIRCIPREYLKKDYCSMKIESKSMQSTKIEPFVLLQLQIRQSYPSVARPIPTVHYHKPASTALARTHVLVDLRRSAT